MEGAWRKDMEKLTQFWQVVLDVWDKGVFGVDLGRIIVALLILFGFLLIRRWLTRVFMGRLAALAERTSVRVDDEVVEVLEDPFSFIPVVLGVFLAAEYLSLSGRLDVVFDRTVRSLVVFVIFWSLVRLVRPLSFFLEQLKEVLSIPMAEWLLKGVRAAFTLIGAATVLEIWGIQVGPILAGLGLFGVAVALGAQDLFKNLIAGILIIAEGRFHPGDWVRVDGVVEGTVESIGFRSTLIRRFDKAPVYVPNANLSDSAVTNFSSMTHRRICWTIGVEYRTTVAQLRKIRDDIESYILGSESFAHPPEVATFVRIDGFNDSSIDIMLYCFTRTTVWGEWLKIKEGLAYKIKEIVEAAGTSFAFPSRSVYVETVPAEEAEIFVPPLESGTGP
jgi:MscS family membrane protein